MLKHCELASRNRIRAYRAEDHVLIVAEGELPSPGFDVDITPSLLRIYPQQFNLVRCPKPGFFPQVVTAYRYAESVAFPTDRNQISVHHADGRDDIDIEECGDDLSAYVQAVRGNPDRPCPPDADEATGFSSAQRFDEAFTDAVANLPPSTAPLADALARVEVVETGGLFGGFPGFHHLFVRVRRTIT
jgi:hypothetical protein